VSIWHLHNFPKHDNDDNVPRDEAGNYGDLRSIDSLDSGPTTSYRELHLFPSAFSTLSSRDHLWLRVVSVVKRGVFNSYHEHRPCQDFIARGISLC
jgi:hypothetical protein